jgi:hypothetical protein
LNPAILGEIGALGAFPPVSIETPDTEETRTYRIFSTSGYRDKTNQNQGFFRMIRYPAESDEPVQCHFLRKVLNADGVVQITTVDANCRSDALLSPISWVYQNEFEDGEGNSLKSLETSETARVNHGELHILRMGRLYKTTIPHPFTTDWCLLGSVPHLGNPIETPFDLYESFIKRKSSYRIAQGGTVDFQWDTQSIQTKVFYLTGAGSLPYEYYVDSSQRILLVIMGCLVLILDPLAEEKCTQRIEALRAQILEKQP